MNDSKLSCECVGNFFFQVIASRNLSQGSYTKGKLSCNTLKKFRDMIAKKFS